MSWTNELLALGLMFTVGAVGGGLLAAWFFARREALEQLRAEQTMEAQKRLTALWRDEARMWTEIARTLHRTERGYWADRPDRTDAIDRTDPDWWRHAQ
jgi:hypothetical protein